MIDPSLAPASTAPQHIANEASNEGAQGTFHAPVTIQYWSAGAPLATIAAPPPRQFRPPTSDFVGREREIEQIVAELAKAAEGGAIAAISSVRAMGGMGKTELAYAVIQRIAPQFPDGHVLLDLRGASTTLMSSTQVIQTVIHAFLPEAKLPDDPAQLQALYRETLREKRVLIFADDAADAEQLKLLVPLPPGCALLITSRNRFSLPKMLSIDLTELSGGEAEKLLLDICPRIGTHAARLAQLCGYLPLALRISASLLNDNDDMRIDRHLDKLSDTRTRLEQLRDPDNPDVSVEASLRRSYDALDEVAKRVLPQLGVFPDSFDLEAAQAVLMGARDVEQTLNTLRRRNLVEWNEENERYDLHDLVRAFAESRLQNARKLRVRHAQFYMSNFLVL